MSDKMLTFSCDICNVSCSGPENLLEHKNSNKHKKKVLLFQSYNCVLQVNGTENTNSEASGLSTDNNNDQMKDIQRNSANKTISRIVENQYDATKNQSSNANMQGTENADTQNPAIRNLVSNGQETDDMQRIDTKTTIAEVVDTQGTDTTVGQVSDMQKSENESEISDNIMQGTTTTTNQPNEDVDKQNAASESKISDMNTGEVDTKTLSPSSVTLKAESKSITAGNTSNAFFNQTITGVTLDASGVEDLSDFEISGSSFLCRLCAVNMTGAEPYLTHMRGQRHAKKVKELKMIQLLKESGNLPEATPGSSYTFEHELNVSHNVIKSLSESGNPDFFCELCKVTISGPDCAKQHYEGKPHRKKLTKQQIMRGLP